MRGVLGHITCLVLKVRLRYLAKIEVIVVSSLVLSFDHGIQGALPLDKGVVIGHLEHISVLDQGANLLYPILSALLLAPPPSLIPLQAHSHAEFLVEEGIG